MTVPRTLVAALLIALVAAMAWWVLQDDEPTPQHTPSEITATDPDTTDPEPETPEPERAEVEPEPPVEDTAEPEQPPPPEFGESTGAIVVTLRGILMDGVGRAVEGAQVSCIPGNDLGGFRRVMTGPDGRFALGLDNVPRPMDAPFNVRTKGFQLLDRTVSLVPGEDQDLGVITLEAAAMVAGTVVMPDGISPNRREVMALPVTACQDLLDKRKADPRAPVRFSDLARFLGTPGGSASYIDKTTFRFENLEPVDTVVWVVQEGCDIWLSDVLKLSETPVVDDLVVRLQPTASESSFAGWVLDPDGNGVKAQVRVEAERGKDFFGSQTSIWSGDDGRFRFEARNPALHRFTVVDWQGEFVGASIAAQPGDDVVLQLERPARLDLAVTDPDGDPITRYFAVAYHPDRQELLNPLPSSNIDGVTAWTEITRNLRHAGDNRYRYTFATVGEFAEGRTVLSVPADPFRLHVEAAGYEATVLGPWNPGSLPDVADVVLHPLVGVSGVVLGDGLPLDGATVTLHPVPEDGAMLAYHGFRARSYKDTKAVTRSLDDGTFLLDLRDDGAFFLRVTADGWAPTDLGPMELEAGIGAEDLVVELTQGGWIEGTVLVPPGEDARALTIGASRGDGFLVTTMPEADGTFRLEQLTPGPWEVKETTPVERGMMVEGPSYRRPGNVPPDPFDWQCEVVAGEGVEVVLDLSGPRPAVAGSFLLNHEAPEQWSVSLQAEGRPGEEWQHHELVTNDDGTFRVARRVPGLCNLTLSAYSGQNQGLFVRDQVTIAPGDLPYHVSLTTAPLSGHIPEGNDPQRTWVAFQQQGVGTQTLQARVRPKADGSFHMPHVPIGPGQILYGPSTRRPTKTLPLTVAADGSTVVELGDW